MKHKLSVSIEQDLVLEMFERIRIDKSIKNKSQLVERAVIEFLKVN